MGSKPYSLRRKLRMGLPAWAFRGSVAAGILTFMAATLHANLHQTQGLVGVVGNKARGLALSCGGIYNPNDMVVFTRSQPCGSTVSVINPFTGEGTSARVVHQNLMTDEEDRIADISPALARAIGVDATAPTAHMLVMRAHGNGWRALGSLTPVVPLAPLVVEPQKTAEKKLDKRELTTLTNNMLGECGNCGPLGMVAVAQVTLNRVEMRHNGKSTIHGVVHDKHQFSWVKLNPTLRAAQPNRKMAKKLAENFLRGRLSGEALAVQYKLGKQAAYFYAPALVKNPGWDRRGTIERVPLSRQLQAELRHSFYRPVLVQTASR